MSKIEQSERIAQIAAHRACCGTEHNPAEGKLHGFCVVCGVPWPCAYAGKPPHPLTTLEGETLRNMLRAMQSGEMTVSRGVELVDMWLARNYSDDMLPPVREGLGEDEMPWDRIDALTAQRDEERKKHEASVTINERLLSDNRLLTAQRDGLLAALESLDTRLRECGNDPITASEAYDSFYQEIVSDAIAKVKP